MHAMADGPWTGPHATRLGCAHPLCPNSSLANRMPPVAVKLTKSAPALNATPMKSASPLRVAIVKLAVDSNVVGAVDAEVSRSISQIEHRFQGTPWLKFHARCATR